MMAIMIRYKLLAKISISFKTEKKLYTNLKKKIKDTIYLTFSLKEFKVCILVYFEIDKIYHFCVIKGSVTVVHDFYENVKQEIELKNEFIVQMLH